MCFEFVGFSRESEHLEKGSQVARKLLIGEVKELHGARLSIREIAEELGISKSTTSRFLREK